MSTEIYFGYPPQPVIDWVVSNIKPAAVQVGRFSINDGSSEDDGRSWLIKKVGDTITTDYEGLGKSGIKVSLFQVTDKNSDPVEYFVNSAGNVTDNYVSTTEPADCEYLDDLLDCIGKAKPIRTVFDVADTINDSFYMRYPKLYVKNENTTLNLGGTDRNVHIEWYCNEKADDNYHLHTLFEEYHYNESTGEHETVELEYGHIAKYNANFVTMGGYEVAVSRADFSSGGYARDSANNVANYNRGEYLNCCQALNNLTFKTYDYEYDYEASDEKTSHVYKSNMTLLEEVSTTDSDNRRFSMGATPDIAFLQAIGYLMFGINVQNYLPGQCSYNSFNTDNSTNNGDTDYIFYKGVSSKNRKYILNGCKEATSFVSDQNKTPIIFMGVEDGFWSMTGWHVPDQSHLGTSTEHTTYYCLDRKNYKPLETSTSNLIGYKTYTFTSPSGWSTVRYVETDNTQTGLRDWFFSNQSTSANSNTRFNIGTCDYGPIYESSSSSLQSGMVAFGYYASDGSYLGLWYRNAPNYSLTAAYSQVWRGRPSLHLIN